jgi:putative hydrolase of the HAD superfamily
MIRAICFDLDGVYFHDESFKRFKSLLASKATTNVDPNYVLYASPEMLAFKRGELSEEAYWDFTKEELGLTLKNSEIYDLLRGSYEVNADIKSLITQLRSNGYITCACSNNFITRIRELNAAFKFFDDFDVRVFSFEEGVLKPDSTIFEILVNRSGVLPEEIVYSDDSPEKLAGAKELGIQCFTFESTEQFSRTLLQLGVKIA